ncbi:MAG: hypothetical protein JSW09_07090 [Pseudomonadota bacterium]|nr:MAG: hypothetical protein JSW09_07090 [Pseudomonadota bacterium]
MSSKNFNVVAVQKTEAPKGAPRGTWYRYVIEGGTRRSRITGCRSGSKEQVQRHAEGFADELNARARRGYSVFAPRRGAKPKQ